MLRLRLAATTVLAVTAVLAPSYATASPPVFERIEVNDPPTPDPFLTDVCGFPVQSGATGQATFREITTEQGPLLSVLSVAVVVTVVGPGGTSRFIDAGSAREYQTDDGIVVRIAGSVPGGGVKGQIIIHLNDPDDPNDDEVIVRGGEFDFQRLCRRID